VKVSVVIPTLGRPSLYALLSRINAPGFEVLVVDDRPSATGPLPVPPGVRVIAGRSAGPAAARNVGWRAASHDWVAFLDDDVLPDPGWPSRLTEDLTAAGARVGGVQGVLRVPLPAGRAPTDWERVTAGLADGAWITADMAYRRAALACAGGFDERLPRAFREDAELAYRVRRAGWTLSRGRRTTVHPVRPESPWVSVRTQRGNADDALLRRLYGPRWRSLLEIPPGRRTRHTVVTAAGAAAAACAVVAVAGRGRAGFARRDLGLFARASRATPTPFWVGTTEAHASDSFPRLSTIGLLGWTAAAVWALGTAEFAAARIGPGPRDRREVATMVATSVAIPPVAVAHWLRGWWRWRGARPVPAGARPEPAGRPETTGPAGPVRGSGPAIGNGPTGGGAARATNHASEVSA